MSKPIKYAALFGGVLVALLSAVPRTSFAEEQGTDDASARRQAMDEW